MNLHPTFIGETTVRSGVPLTTHPQKASQPSKILFDLCDTLCGCLICRASDPLVMESIIVFIGMWPKHEWEIHKYFFYCVLSFIYLLLYLVKILTYFIFFPHYWPLNLLLIVIWYPACFLMPFICSHLFIFSIQEGAEKLCV